MSTKKENKITFKSGKGKMYVKATFNTTYVTFTDETGNVVCWSSAGTSGFKGARRSTPLRPVAGAVVSLPVGVAP